jgi:cell division protein ZapA
MARGGRTEEAEAAANTSAASGGASSPGAASPGAVSVDIYDQMYHLRGTDPKHIERLAALVDGKMRAVAAHGSTVDSLRVAVLASLNIADELFALRARYDALAGSVGTAESTMRSRADMLAGMLDEVLEERKAG